MAPDELDDQHWFDLMAGRAAPEAHGRTRADAAWLRAALLAYRAQAPAGAMPDPERRIGTLLARAVAAGVVPPAATQPPPQGTALHHRAAGRLGRWWHHAQDWRRRWASPGLRWTPALAVLVLAAALLVGLQPPPPSTPSEVERGPALQQLSVADPVQRQQQLLLALRAAGLDAHGFERLGRRGVDIELPVPLPPAQAQALQREGLQPTGGPSLVVELLPQAPR